MIKVNGVEIPTPSTYNSTPNLLEDSTENANGDMIRKIISCRWELEMSWDYLTKEQYKALVDIKFMKEFNCTFPSPMGKMITKKMYSGDISADANQTDKEGIVRDWINVSLHFIQSKADKYTGGAY